ncbi:MAG: EFR1 family ferrodoxin [Candidatus Methanofastidiosia archaeon]
MSMHESRKTPRVHELLSCEKTYNSVFHAFNAPKLFFEFLDKMPPGQADVFLFKSSGDPFLEGGATTMVRDALTHKGYHVLYEELVVMPANCIVRYEDGLVKQLYNAAVLKTTKMAEEIVLGKVNLQKSGLFSRIVTVLFSTLEGMGAPFFGKHLKVLERCDLCGHCVKICPTGNIYRENKSIKFAWKCVMCLRCIYTCPQKAITPGVFKFFVLEDYNVERIISGPEIEDFVSESTKGYYRRFYDYIIRDV